MNERLALNTFGKNIQSTLVAVITLILLVPAVIAAHAYEGARGVARAARFKEPNARREP